MKSPVAHGGRSSSPDFFSGLPVSDSWRRRSILCLLSLSSRCNLKNFSDLVKSPDPNGHELQESASCPSCGDGVLDVSIDQVKDGCSWDRDEVVMNIVPLLPNMVDGRLSR